MFIPTSETLHLLLFLSETLSFPLKIPILPSGLVSLSQKGLLYPPRPYYLISHETFPSAVIVMSSCVFIALTFLGVFGSLLLSLDPITLH